MSDELGGMLLLVVAGFLLFLLFTLGSVSGETRTLKAYCEKQGMTYEFINSVDYCVGDNQLHPIEWME